MEDPVEFVNMLRIDVETYHWLLSKVGPVIEKKDTNFRNAIRAEVRLSLTLNYLAIGKLPPDY